MLSGRYNPVIEQGADWRRGFAVKAAPESARLTLARGTVRAQLRRGTPDRPAGLVFDFAAETGAVDYADAADGVAWLVLTPVQTAALPAGTLAFDLFLDLGKTSRLVRGTAEVRRRVTLGGPA